MKIEFDRKLKELRNAKDVTQEQLSAHLKISPQAVSKWERGEGYPDITLLPRIAAYFGITVDELLGTDRVRINEKITAWKNESSVYRSKGDLKSEVELWKNAYREYPQELEVMGEYLHSLSREFGTNFEQSENSLEMSELIIKLGEDILSKAIDSHDRGHALKILSYTYDQIGNTEKALECADMQGDFWDCREMIRCSISKGESNLIECQRFILDLVDALALTVAHIESSYPTRERIEIIKYILNLYQGIFVDGDFDWMSVRMRQYCRDLSGLYAEAGDRDNCIKYLADSAYYAKMHYELRNSKQQHHTSLLINKLDFVPKGVGSKNYTCNEAALVLKALEYRVYDPYRDDPEFIRIKNELETIAVW